MPRSMGIEEPYSRMEKTDFIVKNHFKIVLEDGDMKPLCFQDEETVEGMRKSLHQAVIVKLLGKTIGHYGMKHKLHSLWMNDIGNGFFMVKFDLKEDSEKTI